MTRFERLISSIRHGSETVIATYLKHGGNPNASDEDGFALLHWACQEGRLRIAKRLLDAGANPNLKERNGFSPLHLAVGENHPKVVTLLLNRGADPNTRCESDDLSSPLHKAAAWDRARIASILIQAGADAAAQDASGATPVDYAKRYRNRDALKVLRKI